MQLTNLIIGTQTNKATITYGTNTARTLTIPPLGGNRTFAFINQEQTFTLNQRFSSNVGIDGLLRVGNNLDNITDTKKITVESNGYAGLELLGDTSNTTLEPGGAYILLAQDGSKLTTGSVKAMIGIVQNADGDGAGGTYTGTTANSVYFGHKFNGPLHIGTNGNVRFTIAANGNATFTGTVTANSDIRLKTNIKTITNSLEKVLSLRGVEYDRIDIEETPHQIGLIAQEIEEVIPEVVNTNENGFKSVAYQNLIALVIQAIKELNDKVDKLKNKN
jgi:hypothetical protein